MTEHLVQQTLFKVDTFRMVQLAHEAKKSDRDWAHKLLYYIGILDYIDRCRVLQGDMGIIDEEDSGYSLIDRQDTRNVLGRLAGRE